MAKDDLASVDGKVTDLTGGGIFRILLDNGVTISAKLCGSDLKSKSLRATESPLEFPPTIRCMGLSCIGTKIRMFTFQLRR
jgi:hypothetical protein